MAEADFRGMAAGEDGLHLGVGASWARRTLAIVVAASMVVLAVLSVPVLSISTPLGSIHATSAALACEAVEAWCREQADQVAKEDADRVYAHCMSNGGAVQECGRLVSLGLQQLPTA